MYLLQSSSLVPLHYRHGFHSRLENLDKLLRYFLGGERPTQTTHQILSLLVFTVQVRECKSKEWYFTDDSDTAETISSKSPTYATQLIHTLNIRL